MISDLKGLVSVTAVILGSLGLASLALAATGASVDIRLGVLDGAHYLIEKRQYEQGPRNT